MIDHEGFFIYGTHESPIFAAPELQTVRTKFMGVWGESEIRGQAGGRHITIPIMIHRQFTTSDGLMSFLDQIDSQVGLHGTLRIFNTGPGSPFAGGVPRQFPNCTFEGFSKDAGPESGPLPDNVGLLDGTRPSWWVRGTLSFRQVSTRTE